MEHDSLDELLKDNRIMDDEWLALGRALNIDNILSKSTIDRAKSVNQELRHFFGNTIVNVTRNIYEPDYGDPILTETLKICEIEQNTSQKSIEQIEEEIYRKLTNSFKKKHPLEWDASRKNIRTFFDKLIDIGRDTRSVSDIVKDAALTGGLAAVAARFINSAVGVGIVANKLLFDTNWKKVLPAILIVSVIRKRLRVSDMLK